MADRGDCRVAGYKHAMASSTKKIAKRIARKVPSPLLRWPVRIAIQLLLPLAGAVASVVVQRVHARLGPRAGRDGAVVVDINRQLESIAPASGEPAEPLTVLAERAHLNLSGVPGRPVTCLRAVPKRAGDDIRRDVELAKQRLESAAVTRRV